MTHRLRKESTIGILYAGDMGAALGGALKRAGFRVVTTCQDRGAATQSRARESGMEVLDSLRDVAAQSDIVFSIVLPSAAVEVAQQYAELHGVHPPGSLFVEANTIGTTSLASIGRAMADANVQWVDAGIHGTASQLGSLGVIYLSGPDSPQLRMLTAQTAIRTEYLGETPGRASAMKLLMAGMSKSTAAAFFEIAALAERLGMLEPFLENYEEFYPDLMRMIRRTLPTYPQHAGRRIGDVRNLEECAVSVCVQMPLMHEVGNVIGRLADVAWDVESATPNDIVPVIRSAHSVIEAQTIKGELP